jgi:hypothetical protein
MSFLIDGPLLLGTGAAIEKISGDEETAKKLEQLTIVGFLATSISLYMNAPWTRWMADMCKAESGRDWMINSGVFKFEHEKVSGRTHLVSAAIFTTYPMWLRMGRKLAAKTGAVRSAN